ncbi:RNA polymerase sigma factor SigM [Gordonia sp. SID5947]|uniref:RNA polymerase sigma factor SigM n=1 Tax=Gordonia sp. SID5947 TaxID=2690315 RepID=UPI001369C310|nr:RNA polymerase sigma factor SigM [Gordonia sp. SID5947]MYR07672.1 RNA polymerase sigma factor SigM [Gordonia sp. SID5947]
MDGIDEVDRCPRTDRSDSELLAAHTAGDPAAFRALISRHERYLWAVAVRTTRDPDDAADALQEALLNAHRNASRFRGDAQVRSWLHRVVVNACFDKLRRNTARVSVELPEEDAPDLSDGIDPADRVVFRLDITAALAALPEHQRLAVVAVDVEGFSVAETAALLGVAPGTVKSRCARGRAELAKLLGHLRTP